METELADCGDDSAESSLNIFRSVPSQRLRETQWDTHIIILVPGARLRRWSQLFKPSDSTEEETCVNSIIDLLLLYM